MEEINKRISMEFNENVSNLLEDGNLLNLYLKSNSVLKRIKELENVLILNGIDQIKVNDIVNDYIKNLIPPGTKGVIRGLKFNYIVKEYILQIQELKSSRFEIEFEQKSDRTKERPDWLIRDNSSGKTIIGMNQVDLWSGGHQLNRGFKYLEFRESNTKLVCVISKLIKFKSDKTKAYKLFQLGYSKNNLCYLNNLKNIIINYFK